MRQTSVVFNVGTVLLLIISPFVIMAMPYLVKLFYESRSIAEFVMPMSQMYTFMIIGLSVLLIAGIAHIISRNKKMTKTFLFVAPVVALAFFWLASQMVIQITNFNISVGQPFKKSETYPILAVEGAYEEVEDINGTGATIHIQMEDGRQLILANGSDAYKGKSIPVNSQTYTAVKSVLNMR